MVLHTFPFVSTSNFDEQDTRGKIGRSENVMAVLGYFAVDRSNI
jgi:hypothetical protein